MPRFFGIQPGEEHQAEGVRVAVSPDGETVWMHGKWLDLAEDHGVVWIDAGETVRFVKPDGAALRPGAFPAWVVRGKPGRRGAAMAMMFNVVQFIGGAVEIVSSGNRKRVIPV